MLFQTAILMDATVRCSGLTKEQRMETLFVGGNSVASNAAAEFRNDSSVTLSIMTLDYTHLLSNGDNDEGVHIELSKAPVHQSRVNNSPFWTYGQSISTEGGDVTAAAGSKSINGGKSFDKGEVTLEPGESLFMNFAYNGGNAEIDSTYHISYEF